MLEEIHLRLSLSGSGPAVVIFHLPGQVLPVAGLKVHDAAIYDLVFNGRNPIFVLCDAVEGKHDKEGLVVEFFKGGKYILPACMVGVFPWAAGPSEDHKQPAYAGPQGIDRAAVVYEEGTGGLSLMSLQLRLQRLPEGAPQF